MRASAHSIATFLLSVFCFFVVLFFFLGGGYVAFPRDLLMATSHRMMPNVRLWSLSSSSIAQKLRIGDSQNNCYDPKSTPHNRSEPLDYLNESRCLKSEGLLFLPNMIMIENMALMNPITTQFYLKV